MKVINIHTRTILQPKAELEKLFATLASDDDKMLATHKWPPMKLDKGLAVGSKGGHGPIRYHVTEFEAGNRIRFQFDLPGFNGFHEFLLKATSPQSTELRHEIRMETSGKATPQWFLAIRWLHDAFIEDAFDKVENHFSNTKKRTEWSSWVRLLRKIMKPKSK